VKNVFSPGVKVEIKECTLDDNNNNYCYTSQIEEVVKKNILVLGTPIVGGQIIPLRINRDYMLIVYSNKGIYSCKIRPKRNFRKGLVELVKVEIISSLEKIQRREFFRYGCVQVFKFKLNDHWHEGIIKDISGGGIKFITNSDLEVKSKITFRIPIENDYIEVEGIILYREESNVELYKNQYRVRFDNIDKADQDRIIQFIFEQQRKRVRQEKGL
jgi:c-di-GMP-binding flagellar brake protein YcgR